jgi:hypothetical protein
VSKVWILILTSKFAELHLDGPALRVHFVDNYELRGFLLFLFGNVGCQEKEQTTGFVCALLEENLAEE